MHNEEEQEDSILKGYEEKLLELSQRNRYQLAENP